MTKSAKIAAFLAALMTLLALCGCAGDSEDNGKASENAAELNAELYMAAYSEWADEETLSLVSGGAYDAGYGFIDIDFDYAPELAVQYGGGTMLNCYTQFYKLEDGAVVPFEGVAESMSLSPEELSLCTDDDGKHFYLNEYTLSGGNGVYLTAVDRLDYIDNELVAENLFSLVTETSETGEDVHSFAAFGEDCEEDEYYQAYNAYFSELTIGETGFELIEIADWQQMDDAARAAALAQAYSAAIIE